MVDRATPPGRRPLPVWVVGERMTAMYTDLRYAQDFTEDEVRSIMETEMELRQAEVEDREAYNGAVQMAAEGHSRKVIRACFGNDIFLRGG